MTMRYINLTLTLTVNEYQRAQSWFWDKGPARLIGKQFTRVPESIGLFIGKFTGLGKSWNLLGNDADDIFGYKETCFCRRK